MSGECFVEIIERPADITIGDESRFDAEELVFPEKGKVAPFVFFKPIVRAGPVGFPALVVHLKEFEAAAKGVAIRCASTETEGQRADIHREMLVLRIVPCARISEIKAENVLWFGSVIGRDRRSSVMSVIAVLLLVSVLHPKAQIMLDHLVVVLHALAMIGEHTQVLLVDVIGWRALGFIMSK